MIELKKKLLDVLLRVVKFLNMPLCCLKTEKVWILIHVLEDNDKIINLNLLSEQESLKK